MNVQEMKIAVQTMTPTQLMERGEPRLVAVTLQALE